MDDKDTQAATEPTNEQPKAAPEVAGEQEKQDDLEVSLKEFDAATGSDDEQPSDTKADDDTVKRLKALETEVRQREYQEDLNKLISRVRGDFTEDEVDNEFIDTWLVSQAKKDPRVANAWMRRNADPTKFARVEAGLKQEFAKRHAKLRKIDEGATADHEAVATAVRRNGNKTSEGPPPKFGELTNKEYQEKVKKEFGYTPRV